MTKQLCDNCQSELVYRMFDVDGTNLVEQLTCTEITCKLNGLPVGEILPNLPQKKILYEISTEDVWGVMQDINIENEHAEKLINDPVLIRLIEDKIAECIDWADISNYIASTIEEYNHEKYN